MLLRQATENYTYSGLQKYLEAVNPHSDYKKVLVTGGAGLLGSRVVKSLLARGDDVVLVDNAVKEIRHFLSNSTIKGSLAVYIGDIHNASFMEQIFVRENPEWICHLAEEKTTWHTINSVGYIQANIEGTLRLLELIKGRHRGGYDIKNFIMLSSHAVYENRKQRQEGYQHIFRTEDEPNDHPTSTYSASKKSAELFAYTYHHLYRIPVSVLRMFPVYGPEQLSNMSALKLADRTGSNSQLSDFSNHIDFFERDNIHIDDAVRAILRSLDRPYGYEIFNIGGGNSGFCTNIHFLSAHTLDDLSGHRFGKLSDIVDTMATNGATDFTKYVDEIFCADMKKTEYFLDFKHQVETRYSFESQENESPLQKPFEDQPFSFPNAFHFIHETSFRTWLRRLAFLQWLFIIAILSARAYFRLICKH
jgi:UDP-glucuronate 4-epimerase